MADNRELAVVLKLVADQFQSELRNSQGTLGQFTTFLNDWKTQLAAAGTALFAVAMSTANFGEEALKTSQRLGTTVEITTALQHAAHMADVPVRTLEIGLKNLAQAAVQASSGGGDGAKLFTQLGLSATDAAGKLKPLDQLFFELQDRLNGTRSQAEFLDAGTKALGKSFLEMVPLIRQGSEATKAAMEDGRRLGVVLGQDDAQAASRFNDEVKKLDATTRGLTLQVGTALVPAFTQLLKVMGDGATGPISKVFKIEMQGLSSIFILLGHGIKETAMELDIFFKKIGQTDAVKKFWDEVLVQSRKNLNRDTDKRLHEVFQDQLGKVGGSQSTPPTGGGRSVELGATVPATKPFDQIAYAKALNEIWQVGNRALEIQKKLLGEELDLMFRQEQIADEIRQSRDAGERELVGRGVADAEQMLKEQEEFDRRTRDGLIQNAQAWIDYDNQVGASMQLRYDHQIELLKANLAKQLQLTTEESGRLLIAWQNHDSQLQADVLDRTTLTAQERETVELQSLTRLAAINEQYNGTIFDGWQRGLENYVRNTDSAFGFAAQMAQRTAQFMEQSFRTVFFDMMDGKIKSMKDLFVSFGNFVKQILSQIMAQLATMLALKAITGGFGGGFGGLFGGLFGGGSGGGGGANAGGLFGGLRFNAGGMVPRVFASGGAVLGSGNQDTVRALLTPGEGVLTRRGMAALDRLNAGIVPTAGEGTVIVNIHNSGRTDAPQVNYRRQMKGMIVDIIYRDPDLRQMLGAGA